MYIGSFVVLYVVALILFVSIDLLWLGVIARDFYRKKLEAFMGDFVWIAVCIFYPLFTFGLTYFVTYPLFMSGSYSETILTGLLFGLIAYGTYDLTNWATLKLWSPKLVFVDMLWGATLSGVVAGLTLAISGLFI